MNLIEFKDLPDTSTPLNAENLNHNFNELKKEFLLNKKELQITSNEVELNGTTRNFYIENEKKITIFFSFKTKVAFTANTKYDITVNCPIPDNYYATAAYANPNNPSVVGLFMLSNGKLQICPSENLTTGIEINGQLTYFKK